ncbi:MAG: TIGR00269 family protein [Methanobacterium sp.]|nr:TIGR00269 family protein [Methanobacterium sp.]
MNSCTKCGNTHIIIRRKQSGQSLCKECFLASINEKVLKNIRKYKLIEKGDKVLMALSGGKDSVVALNILNSLKERNIIDLTALTIDEGIKGYREEGIKIAAKNAQKLGVDHKIVSFKDYLGLNLDDMMAKNDQIRHACTYCGVFRRWILNREAQEEEATKIATGHNLDDETQSIIMNYLEGNINNLVRIGPKTEAPDKRFTVKIKPLREIPEKEVGLYAVAAGLKVHLSGCPYAGESFRWEIGSFIKELSINHPTIMYSTLKGFEKIKTALKKEITIKGNLGVCKRCGEPAADDLCKACTFLKDWDVK